MRGGWRWNAGRPGSGRPEMENSIRLTTKMLRDRKGFIHVDSPNAKAEGDIGWNRGGDDIASIKVRIVGYCLTLIYAHKGNPVEQTIDLESQPCRFGGQRIWFRCPRCGGRCGLLMFGHHRFACRKCNRGQYQSQVEDETNRSWGRTYKIQKRLGMKGGSPYLFPTKPKGMHQTTFDKLRSKLIDEECYRERLLIGFFKTHFPEQYDRLRLAK